MRIETTEDTQTVTDLLSLEKRVQKAEDRIGQLETAWTGNYKKTVTMASDLRRLKQMYEQAMTEVASLADHDSKELLALQSDISDKISKTEQELRRQVLARDFLQDESAVAHRLKANLDQTQRELETLVKEFGEKTKIEESVRHLESQIEDRRVQIRKEQALSSILVCGLDYLRTTPSDVCPLCKSRIACHDIIEILEKETGEKEGAKAIRQLQSDLQKLTSEKTLVETALTNYDGLATQMHKLRAAVDTEKQKLRQESFEPGDELAGFVDDELKRINTGISGIDAEMRELRSRATQLTLEVRNLQDKNTRMRSVEKEAQGAVNTSATGPDLIDQLGDQMRNLQEDTKSLERITEHLKTPKKRLGVSKRILDFLKENEKVEKMERGLPALQQRVKELEDKYFRVRELEAGLTDIYNVTSAAREEMVKVALMEMQSFVSKYYSKLMCHPYYVNIELMPEEERGKAIYRIMGWDKELKQGTYVQTRFSNAQMNAVAISLFLSMCVRLQCSFGVILLDDPSQSMDSVHKEALSRVLSDISKERQIVVVTQDPEFKQYMEESMIRPRVITYQLGEWDTEGPQISVSNRSKRKADPKK